jgi:hypothetical protein
MEGVNRLFLIVSSLSVLSDHLRSQMAGVATSPRKRKAHGGAVVLRLGPTQRVSWCRGPSCHHCTQELSFARAKCTNTSCAGMYCNRNTCARVCEGCDAYPILPCCDTKDSWNKNLCLPCFELYLASPATPRCVHRTIGDCKSAAGAQLCVCVQCSDLVCELCSRDCEVDGVVGHVRCKACDNEEEDGEETKSVTLPLPPSPTEESFVKEVVASDSDYVPPTPPPPTSPLSPELC